MEISNYFSKLFLWMFIGLAVTFCTGVVVSNSVSALEFIFSSGGYLFLVLAELGLVIYLSARINKLSYVKATVFFLLYSFVSGLTFSSIFVVYQVESIMLVFMVTAFIFLLFAAIGYFTKRDIAKIGNVLFVGLAGVIVISLINMFLGNSQLDLILCIVGLIIFMGLIVYDIQKLKKLYFAYGDQPNIAIMGALQLYLDFINIFLHLIRLFGKSND